MGVLPRLVARLQVVRLLRPGSRAVVPLEGAALRELLRRRDELLAADERAAVEAALASATPELRAELELRIAYWRERAEAACAASRRAADPTQD